MVISQYKVKLLSPITQVMHLPTSYATFLLKYSMPTCSAPVRRG